MIENKISVIWYTLGPAYQEIFPLVNVISWKIKPKIISESIESNRREEIYPHLVDVLFQITNHHRHPMQKLLHLMKRT